MRLKLQVWRQSGPQDAGHYEFFDMDGLDGSMSLLEMLDKLNETLVEQGKEQITFESDCREGICGSCGLTVDGRPHGPEANTPSCHQRMRSFKDGDTVRIEPLRSAAFPVLRDLMVDRSVLDRLISAGGHVAVEAGTAPDSEALPISHEQVELSLDYAACIGCGACVAACPNGAAHLFTGAKLTHLALLPLGMKERKQRAQSMVDTMEDEFGPCSLYGECVKVCPANVPFNAVAAVSKERIRSFLQRRM